MLEYSMDNYYGSVI